MKSTQAILLILIILVIDQWSKFYVKTHFALHDSVEVFFWFKIYFIENEGMAWGAKIPGDYGKLILTSFRLLAIVGIGYWLYDVIKKNSSWVLTLSISMIFCVSGAYTKGFFMSFIKLWYSFEFLSAI